MIFRMNDFQEGLADFNIKYPILPGQIRFGICGLSECFRFLLFFLFLIYMLNPWDSNVS